MRLVQRGIANNFGLVGKNLRKYLATTALTATGLMIAASPAFADNSWVGHEVIDGSTTVTTPNVNTTNIQQHTMNVTARGDADIHAGDTVNIAQPSNNSKYIVYDIKQDPTKIMGNLNANGKVYIFDQNGVIFGEGSQVNVGGIVTSTGHISDANIKADKNVFENVGTDGEIVNNGSITVAEGGLAAFVAPSVRNNGVINAKAGTVALASGNKVTLDLYGDNLVSIEVEGELENAIIENKGTINAAGGTVGLTVAAAKSAVENVVNMDGIIDVSSVSSKGGKIVVNGGSKGVVKVSGKLKADGATGGGSVKVTGQNIHATETSETSASATTHGDGGTVDFIAQNGLVYNGSIRSKGGVLGGKGGAVDTSGLGWVDIDGNVDVSSSNGQHGSWLIDPTNLTITSVGSNFGIIGSGTEGSPWASNGAASLLRNTSIQNALNLGANVFITTVGSPDRLLQDGTITIAANITKTSGAESTLNLEAAGSIWLQAGRTISATTDKVLNVVMHAMGGLPAIGGVVIDGAIKTNGGDVDLKADTNNIIIGDNGFIETNGGNIKTRADFFLPTALAGNPVTGGTIVNGYVDAQGGNIDMQQSGAFKGDANSVRTSGTGTIELSQSNLLGLGGNITIQNAIDAINNTGTGKNTVNVGIGTYNESVEANVDNLVLNGAWHGINPALRVLVPEFFETVIDPNSPGIHVTADNVTVDGFVITGATGSDGYGVWVDGADNATVKNNIIHGNDSHGVFINNGSNGTTVRENRIYDLGTGIDTADGIRAEGATALDIRFNAIDDVKGNGILVKQSDGLIKVVGNLIGLLTTDVAVDGIWGDGVEIDGVNGNTFVQSNIIANTYDETDDNTNDDSSGIYLNRSSNIVVGGPGLLDGNIIKNVDWDGVKVLNGSGNIVQKNLIDGATRIGIYAENTDDLSILGNVVHDANLLDSGVITVVGGRNHDIIGNIVSNDASSTTNAGIKLHYIRGLDNNVNNNVIFDINGDGMRGTEIEEAATISGNKISMVKGDGIQMKRSAGILQIADNFIGRETQPGGIEGNGVYLSGVHNSFITGNEIWNTKASNPANGDDASGVYLDNVHGNTVEGNFIRNADWDGVKIKNGYDNIVKGNDIAHTTRIGIYGENTDNLSVLDNTVHDSNLADSGGITVVGGRNHDIIGNTVHDIIGTSGTNAGIKVHYIRGDDNNIKDNIIYNINGDGIRGSEIVTAGTISGNDISLVKGDGIRMLFSGILTVDNNFIGNSDEIGGIEGNGVYFTGVHNSFITNNTIWNTKASNPSNGDDASGVYLDNVHGNTVGNNLIRGADWDGIKIKNGYDNVIQDNDIANTTRIGIYGENTDNLSVLRNTVFDSNLADSGEITIIGGRNHDIVGNDVSSAATSGSDAGIKVHYIRGTENFIQNNIIYNINGDGIRGSEIVEYAEISGNDIDDVARNGIEVYDFGNLLVDNNDVRDAGENGFDLAWGDDVTVSNNRGLGGTDNGVSNVGENGIKVGYIENFATITNNEVDLAGYDGIHLHYFNDALIQGNEITRSGDDGIEAHDGHWVEIDNNDISQSGYGIVDEEEGGEDYGGFDEFNSGGDGIHVRNMYVGKVFVEEEEGSESEFSAFESDSEDASVRITNNIIDVSKDDGVDVERVEGYVYIAGNTITDSGVTNDGTTVIYTTPDYYGADGIHVKDIDQGEGGYTGDIREGDAGNGEYNIVVYDNDVDQSLDDGVEILGSGGSLMVARVSALEEGDYEEEYDYWYGNTGRVLVQQNVISNSGWGNPADGFGQSYNYYSGGDGIHVEGIYTAYGEGSSAGVSEEGVFGGYAVDILGNTVNQSGDDGIDVEWSSSTLIDQNTVTNSGWTGETEGEIPDDVFTAFATGTGADWYGADGIFVNNVGEQYYYGGYDKVSALVEGPGDGYQEYSVVIRRNDVDNSLDDGIQVNNTLEGYGEVSARSTFGIYGLYGYTAPVLIGGNNAGDGNTVTDSGNHGLYISGYGHNNVIVSGNGFANFDIGAEFESGLIDLTGAGNTFSTGRIGLRFAPYGFSEEIPAFAKLDFYGDTYLDLVDNDGFGSTPYPTTPTNFGGTIGEQTFTGFTETGDFYVYLADGAFTNDGTPIWLNGLNSSYDGITPSSTGGILTQEQFDFLEARFRHFPDAGASSTDIFWFGFVPEETALIDQSLIFNRFGAFNGDATGLNVRIVSLPFVPGGNNPTPSALNSITTFAGNNTPTDPANLNQIETAAGGDQPNVPQNLNNIETVAGGENEACWGNAMAAASGGQVVNVVYTGGFADNLNQAAACGTGF